MIADATPAMMAACEGYSGCIGVAFERRPTRIALGGVVVVLVAVADRCDRPPEIIGELRIPVGDEGVGDAHVEQREQAGVLGEGECLRRRKLARRRLATPGPRLAWVQNFTASVCSGVRVVLLVPPMFFVSL